MAFPNYMSSKKLTGHVGFGLSVHSSRNMQARVLKFHIWIPHGKMANTHLFLSELSPVWSYAPLNVSE